MTNPFAVQKQVFEPLINAERWLMTALATGALAGTFLPVMFPMQIPEVKLIENIAGLVSGGMFTISAFLRSQKEKDYRAIAEANHAIVKEGLKCDFTYEQSCQQIMSRRRLAAGIKQLFEQDDASADECYRWIQEYGLHGLIELPQIQHAVVEKPEQRPALKGVFNPNQSTFEQISDDLAVPVDYSWMDAKFINASKAVFGSKGSGKSVYLAYEAIAFLTHYPDGELRIGDKHFDEDQSRWLPGVPTDILLNQFVAKKPEQILKMFRRAKQLLDYRIDKGIKQNHSECKPFKLICDEFDSFIMELTDAEKTEVINIITQTQNEGRKYLINITLGTHSLKKEQIGIDSSVLFQMDVLCLGLALADPNTKFPTYFDSKSLLKRQIELQRTLKKSQGFACVVCKLGETANVEVVPFLDLSQFTFDVGSQEVQSEPEKIPQSADINPYQIIKDWIEQLGKNPTDSQLIEAWKKVTGIELSSDALQLLKNKLELTDEAVTWATITADLQLPEKWKEEDLQKAIASRLIEYGYKVQTEVKYNGGFIDIFTDFDGGTIVEVKRYLTRDTIYQAVGQLSLYGRGNRYKLLAMGFLPSNDGDQQQAKTTASMVSQDERISCLFI
ncbi:MAG: hypothetical protein ACKPKK_12465 [Dolichospermum sp.]